jgi:hypothetical protein
MKTVAEIDRLIVEAEKDLSRVESQRSSLLATLKRLMSKGSNRWITQPEIGRIVGGIDYSSVSQVEGGSKKDLSRTTS